MENIIYGRFMRKEEARQTRKSNLLGKTTDEELVPAFEATKVLGVLDELSSEKLIDLHKLIGGDGSARIIVLFIPEEEPVVSGIPFRNSDEINDILGYNLRESKFKSGTKISINGTIKI